MEPVVNKLQEGVKYPRFERDATKTINDLVDHITKERGVYSSSIEPNPSEHNVWFNTDTNTLMIYNNNVWRDFSGSSSGWSVENALTYRNKDDILTIHNIKDKTFYILHFDAYTEDRIDIPNLSDNIEFYIFADNMPSEIHFLNSNVITNYDAIAKSIDRISLSGMSILIHKIGIIVEFSIINKNEDVRDSSYLYNTKLEEVYMTTLPKDGRPYYYTVKSINNSNTNEINQIKIELPSNIPTSSYTNGSFATNEDIQIVYSPLKYDTSTEYFSSICVFKNIMHDTNLRVMSSLTSVEGVHQNTDYIHFPLISIFDKFNPNNVNTICTTYFPNWVEDDNIGLIIKDNWYFNIFTQNFQDGMLIAGLSIIIDDFPINKNNEFFTNSDSIYCNDLIINNSSDDDMIRPLIERIIMDTFVFTAYDSYTFTLPSNSLIYTTNYKSKYIGIPYNTESEFNEMTIIIANKLRDDTEIIIDISKDDIYMLGKINIFTIPENVSILKNLINTDKPHNITIYGTLTVNSIYDDKGLETEAYQYSIDDVNYEYTYERYDTPVIA